MLRGVVRWWGTVRYGLPVDFDEAEYLQLNPDVRAAKADPVRHYLKHGLIEGRRWSRKVPGDFDPIAYLRLNPDVAAAGIDPAQHFLKHGRSEGRLWKFDLPEGFSHKGYLSENPDLAAANVDPAVHYTKYGRSEGRRWSSAATSASPGAGDSSSADSSDIQWVAGSFIAPPVFVGTHGKINIIAFLKKYWGVPQSIGQVDFFNEAQRSRPEIICADTQEQLHDLLEKTAPAQTGRVDASLAARISTAESALLVDPVAKIEVARTANPRIPREEIAEHKYAKVNDTPKIFSVVIPYFRKSSTMLRCLEALRDQSYELCSRDDIEIIVVDDGTPGETIHEKLPDDVHYVWQKKVMYGICRAKNTGAKLANGRYLSFVDPDVLVSHHYFDNILRGFAKFGDRAVQTGYVWGYHFEGSPDPRTEFGVWEKPGVLTKRFCQVAGLNVTIARDLFNETPGFDEDLIYGGVEDILFGYHVGLLPGTAIVFNPDMEVHHIPHPMGGAHLNVGKTWEIVRRKWPEFYEFYLENGSR